MPFHIVGPEGPFLPGRSLDYYIKWNDTIKFFNEVGWPESVTAVLIGNQSAIRTAKQLQELVGLPEEPPLEVTYMVDLDDEPIIPEGCREPEAIHICRIRLHDLKTLRRKTEYKSDTDFTVRFNNPPYDEPGLVRARNAVIVLSIKEEEQSPKNIETGVHPSKEEPSDSGTAPKKSSSPGPGSRAIIPQEDSGPMCWEPRDDPLVTADVGPINWRGSKRRERCPPGRRLVLAET